MLDALVIAPHPDDAELGMGGTIVRLLGQGWKVGILDLTSGEPTPLGSLETRARETAEATKALGLTWRRNLGLPNRSLEPTLLHRRELAAVFREARPRLLFAPFWEDRPPRPHGGDEARRGCPVLEQAFQERHPRRAIPPVAGPVLLQRPSPDRRAAQLPDRHLRPARRQARLDAGLSLAARGQPAARETGRYRRRGGSEPLLGQHRRRPPRRALRQPGADWAHGAGWAPALSHVRTPRPHFGEVA